MKLKELIYCLTQNKDDTQEDYDIFFKGEGVPYKIETHSGFFIIKCRDPLPRYFKLIEDTSEK